MNSSEPYEHQMLNDLVRDNTVSLKKGSVDPVQDYREFDHFDRRSLREEHRQRLGKPLYPEHIPPSQMEPELQKAIAQIKPNERHSVAREFLKRLKARGLSDRDLEQQLDLSTHHVNRMNAGDVSKLATFSYHTYPDIFQDVLAEQPAIVKFLSIPLMGAILNAIAVKWLGNRRRY